MLAPEKSFICTSSKMEPAFDFFMCGLCNFLVSPMPYDNAPFALQCAACHSLYCESCVNTNMIWMCPKPVCKSQ